MKRNIIVYALLAVFTAFDSSNSASAQQSWDFQTVLSSSDVTNLSADAGSFNRFWDTGKSSLCGMKSESGPNYISYDHNWYAHSDSRHPRIRTMSVHVWNNYFDGISKYGVGATMGSSVFVEANYFRATKYPMLISMQGSDMAGGGTGTFSGENGGIIKSFGNVMAEQPSSFRYATYQTNATKFDAWEASSRSDVVPSGVKTRQGGTSYDNFDTNASLMYTYAPDDAADVPAKVCGWWGARRMNHGDFNYGLSGSDSSYDVDETLKATLAIYSSSLVGFFSSDDSSGGEGGDDNGGGQANSNPGFCIISGNYANNKGTATVYGTAYTDCLKMESATSIAFTLTQKMALTLYFADTEAASIRINGTKYADNVSTYSTILEAGSYELTKNGSVNLFFIKLEKAE